MHNPAKDALEHGYTQRCNTPSDIYEHLPTLRMYASQVKSIVECGVRSVVSSYAFACALKDLSGSTLTMVDPEKSTHVEEFVKLCHQAGLDAKFFEESDLTCPLIETDLLFIDTWHVYAQLKRELSRWHPYVHKYIILHDTTVDEWEGETIRMNMNAQAQSAQSGFPLHEILKGLWPAVEEFLQEHKEWRILQRFTNNNGLTVLERVLE